MLDISNRELNKIKELRAKGITINNLAKRFHISNTTVYRILKDEFQTKYTNRLEQKKQSMDIMEFLER